MKTSRILTVESAPELVRTIGTRGGWSAMYEGPGSVTVELYELTSPAGGLEIVQQWHPAPDAVVWYTPHYFVVVKWQGTDRKAVKTFIRGIQRQFAEPQ